MNGASVNSTSNDTDPFLSDDLRTIIFESERDSPAGMLYEASR